MGPGDWASKVAEARLARQKRERQICGMGLSRPVREPWWINELLEQECGSWLEPRISAFDVGFPNKGASVFGV